MPRNSLLPWQYRIAALYFLILTPHTLHERKAKKGRATLTRELPKWTEGKHVLNIVGVRAAEATPKRNVLSEHNNQNQWEKKGDNGNEGELMKFKEYVYKQLDAKSTTFKKGTREIKNWKGSYPPDQCSSKPQTHARCQQLSNALSTSRTPHEDALRAFRQSLKRWGSHEVDIILSYQFAEMTNLSQM